MPTSHPSIHHPPIDRWREEGGRRRREEVMVGGQGVTGTG